jgi:hypothetical protein
VRRVTGSRGALLLVGGHSRGVGKTLTAERILRARRGEPWVAIKVSAHRHGHAGDGLSIDDDATPSAHTQTGRYLIAGARRALLVHAPDTGLAAAADVISRLRADGLNLVVESNRLVDWVVPDRILFAMAPQIADWKPSSSRIVTRADAFVVWAGPGSGSAGAVYAADAPTREVFRLGDRIDEERFADWLDNALGPRSLVARSVAKNVRVSHAVLV